MSSTQYSFILCLPTDDVPSVYLDSWSSYRLCRVLDEWPTSRTTSSSGSQKAPFYRKPSFDAQNTRMGDVCEVETRTQSVVDLSRSIHLMSFADSDIIHVNALGTSIVVLNSYRVATDLLVDRSGIYSSR